MEEKRAISEFIKGFLLIIDLEFLGFICAMIIFALIFLVIITILAKVLEYLSL